MTTRRVQGARTAKRMQGTMPTSMIILPVLVPLIAVAVGCDDVDTAAPPPEEWAAICVDPRNVDDPADDVRIDDSACGDYDDDGDPAYSSYVFLWSNTNGVQPVPAVGSRASGYGTHRHFPPGSYTMHQLPKEGAPTVKSGAEQAVKANPDIRRGGLGVSAGAGKAGSKAGGSAGG